MSCHNINTLTIPINTDGYKKYISNHIKISLRDDISTKVDLFVHLRDLRNNNKQTLYLEKNDIFFTHNTKIRQKVQSEVM